MKLEDIKKISIENKIPIIRDQTANYISNFIIDKKITTMLEIGSGFGYSSYYFFSNKNNITIDSIEKNIDRYNFCINNINIKNINFINTCAYEFIPNKKYQCIFLDGPKSKQKNLFEKYAKFLENNGYIIIDNFYLKDLNYENKNTKKLINKNLNFQEYLIKLKEWNINILDIDDGIVICNKRNKFNEISS